MAHNPPRRSTLLHAVLTIILLAACGCGPSAEERQAEALLVRAQEMSLTGGKYQARWAAHMQAEKLFKEVIQSYPKTNAAKRAAEGLKGMPAIFEADKRVAAEELSETYKAAVGGIMDAAAPRR